MEQLNINDENNTKDPSNQNDLQKMITENLQGGDIKNRKIFSYQDKAPAAPEFHQNPLRVVYSVKTPMSTKSGTRFIPSSPDRILDAPDIINDYCKFARLSFEHFFVFLSSETFNISFQT